MTANPEDREEWATLAQQRICEAAPRLLAALGPEPRFAADTAGLEAMLERARESRPTKPIGIKLENPEELPRYEGDFGIWVSPAGHGCLRLRVEVGELRSETAILRPDGSLSAFETLAGFGVPEAEWTERARADAALVERRYQRALEEGARLREDFERRQARFLTENLLTTHAAPPQAEGRPVVSFVSLYRTGVAVNYLLPAPTDEEAPIEAAIELSDGLGTAYVLADLGGTSAHGPLRRARESFTPAVPAAAKRLSVRLQDTSVEIELGER